MDIVVLDLIKEIRAPVKDKGTTGSTEWSNQEIITKLNEALQMIFDDRPDLFMVTEVVIEAPQVAVEGDKVSIVTSRAAIVHGTVALLLKENSGDKYSQKSSEAHLKDFYRILGA